MYFSEYVLFYILLKRRPVKVHVGELSWVFCDGHSDKGKFVRKYLCCIEP